MSGRIDLVVGSDEGFPAHVASLWALQQWQPHSHTVGALRYYAQRPQDCGLGTRDVSFALLHDGLPAAAFLGALVAGCSTTDLKAYEIPALCLFAVPAAPSVIERFLAEIGRIFEQVTGSVLVRDFLQQGAFSPLALYLLRRGACLRTYAYQLVDLSSDESAIWRGLRKSYKSLVNLGERMLRIEIMEAASADWSGMNAFRELHIRVAGKETRSIDSWRRQFEWIQEGSAFLILGWLNDELVTAGMFTHTGSMCTYFSSASRRDLFDKPMFHALMWKGMVHAKAIGCRWFDINEKYFPNNPVPECDDTKLMSISDFKLGFGGALKPVVDFELNCASCVEMA